MIRKLFLVAVVAVTSIQLSMAQERTVTGIVRSDDGETLPGANVVLKGSTTGTSTDMDGKYSITVPGNDAVLVISFVGMETREETVGARSNIDVSMNNGQLLEEVVVTALGISRDKKVLGYATQTVSGEDVARVKDVNFMSALSGQVAGAQIKNSGTMGGSANVIIRGYKSIGGNNQPLYVVDGIPISNEISNSQNQSTGRGGFDYGNAAMDINPDDIQSINVLKGAAATALYGSRAANGVVIIVTKKGSQKKKGVGVTISSGAIFGNINKNTFPVYQKEYGAGYGHFYGNDTAFNGAITDAYMYEVDLDGDGNPDALQAPLEEDAAYGLAFDTKDPNGDPLQVLSWESVYPELTETYRKTQPYQAGENDASTFYETSVMLNNSVSVEGGSDKGTYRISLADMNQKGVLPNSRLRRDNASMNVSYDLNDKLNVSSSVSFIQTNGLGRYGTGYNSRNPNNSFRQWYQVEVDMQKQKEAYENTGKNLTWNPLGYPYGEADKAIPHYWDNPYFMRFENYNTDNRNRIIGNMMATYKITDWLSAMGRVTNDSYDEIREERIAVGSVDVPMYYKYTRSFYERNYDFILSFNKALGTDGKISLDGNLGTNIRRQQSTETEGQTNGGLIVPGVYSLSNGVNGMIAPTFLPSTNDWKILQQPYEKEWKRAVDGYFGRGSVGYGGFLFVDLSFRYDISSTLPLKDSLGKKANDYPYPAATLSFVYSELINLDVIDFGKIRFNYAEVGNDAPVQSLYSVYNLNTSFMGTALATAPNTNLNPRLLPERTKALELGFENKFMKNRAGLDLTFYKSNSYNQILAARVSSASGTIYQYINAGNIQNQGIELSVYAVPVKLSNGFEWTSRVNWAVNRNEVIELTDNLTTYQLANMQGGVTVEAEVGQPFGVIKGTNFVYDGGIEDEDHRVVRTHPSASRSGVVYAKTAAPEVIGNMLPDWTGGWLNTLKFKNFQLSALIDVQKGGEFFSLDTWYGYATGLYDISSGNNDKGTPVRERPENGGGVPMGGVLAAYDATGAMILDEDGNPTSSGTANTEYGWMGDYANATGYAYAPNALHVYDASYVKLRQLNLTYSLPKTMIEKWPITGLDVSLIGRNLAILYKNCPYTDPEAGLSAGNVQGYQSGAYPSVREYGFNVTVKF